MPNEILKNHKNAGHTKKNSNTGKAGNVKYNKIKSINKSNFLEMASCKKPNPNSVTPHESNCGNRKTTKTSYRTPDSTKDYMISKYRSQSETRDKNINNRLNKNERRQYQIFSGNTALNEPSSNIKTSSDTANRRTNGVLSKPKKCEIEKENLLQQNMFIQNDPKVANKKGASNKAAVVFEKKKVAGYNFFANRQKELGPNCPNVIKNVPVSIFVGTWNCEYFDFTKESSYENKRHTTEEMNSPQANLEHNSKKSNRNHSVRSVTPILFSDPIRHMNMDDETIDENADIDTYEKMKTKRQTSSMDRTKHSNSLINSNYEQSSPKRDSDLGYSSSTYQNLNITVIDTSEHETMKTKGKQVSSKSNNIKKCVEIANQKHNVATENDKSGNREDTTLEDGRECDFSLEDSSDKGKIDMSDDKSEFLKVKKNYFQHAKHRNKFPFACWVPPYQDIYVICLQESISDNIIDCISLYLKEINQETYAFLPLADYKLSGYGDGAFLQTKSTTIAAWVKKTKLYPNGPVKLCASKSIAFNKLNNSKGCVSILFNIFNQFVLFIGCHMPAKDSEIRQKSREFILTRLSEYFSNKASSNFKEVFHHVIWAGDFNFRVQGIDIEDVVRFLKTNNLKEFLKYDELQTVYSEDFVENFEELPITFLPTYKKVERRPAINKNDENWVEKEYKLIHNIKWYKGGKQEPRIPSWTDRVFKWSCTNAKNCLNFVPNSYTSPLPEDRSILLSSDHNPVSCSFLMYKMKNESDIPPTKNIWKF